MVIITKCGEPFDSSGFIPPANGNGVSGPGLGNPWDPSGGSDPNSNGTYIPFDPPDDGSDTSSTSGSGSTSGIPFLFIPPGPVGGLAPQLAQQQVACFLQDPSGYINDPPIYIPWVPLDLSPFTLPYVPPSDEIYTRCKTTLIPCPPPPWTGDFERLRRRREPCTRNDYNTDSPARDYLTDVVGHDMLGGYHSDFDNLCTNYANAFFNNCLDSVGLCTLIPLSQPTLPSEYLKCSAIPVFCDPPNQTKQKQIKRKLVTCSQEELDRHKPTRDLWNGLVGDTPPYNNVYDNVCTNFDEEYYRGCIDGPMFPCVVTGPRGGGVKGPTTGGPGGPADTGPGDGPTTQPGGGPVTIPPLGPGTGGLNAATFRCNVGPEIPCPAGTRGPSRRDRRLVPCTAGEASNDIAEGNRRKRTGRGFSDNGPWNDNAAGLCLVDQGTLFAGCINDPASRCIALPGTGGRGTPVDAADGTPQEPQQPQEPQSPGGPRIDESTWLNQERLDRRSNSSELPKVGSIDNAALRATSIISEVVPRKIIDQDLTSTNQKSYLFKENNSTSVNNTEYNFFKVEPKQTTRIVANDKYLNIFNDSVAEEIKYFLDYVDTAEPWNEIMVQSVTNEKIIMSLRRDLLESFNNLQSSSRINSNFDKFILMIKSQLMTGTLNEVDTDYFINLNNFYRNKPIVNIPPQNQAVEVALNTFALNSTNSDYNSFGESIVRNDLKRTRFLLEDIEAKLPAYQLNGFTNPLYLKNAGIPSYQISGSFSYLNIGNGGGYSIDASTVLSGALPLPTSNETSSANYLNQTDRSRMLNLLGSTDSLYLSVSSVSAVNEFSENYNFSSIIEPLYFAIDLTSVEDINNANSYVTPIRAKFRLLTDEDSIEHSRNYTFNTVKINIDYRDPFLQYARDTSALSLVTNEFNLRGFGQPRTPIEGKIILRNVPAAVILTAGRGSSHNPFNGRSEISEYDDVVVRRLEVAPAFDSGAAIPDRPLYQASNTTDVSGIQYYGLFEKVFDQRSDAEIYQFSKDSNIFSKSYYVDGVYDKSITDTNLFDRSAEYKLVNVVDRLSEVSGVSSLTWWDVYRRLTLKEVASLTFNGSVNLINKVSSGWRGVPVRNILSSPYSRPSGIPEQSIVSNDTIIINNKT
jgi:hypothetical protein